MYGLTEFHTKNAIALDRLKTEFKGKVEVLQLPAPVLRDLKKLATEVVREESEKTPMARKVHASFTKFQALLGPWDHVAEGAYHQLVAVMTSASPLCGRGRPGRLRVGAHRSGRSEPAAGARRPFRIGVLNAAWAASHPTVEGLKAGLKELGLEDGRDVTFDIRFTEGKLDAMPAAAEALVKSGVDLIFTSQEAATQAAKDATKTVPIVFTLVGDPVAAGLVRAQARPDGNVTGVSSLQTELVAKRLEFLKTLAPAVHRVWLIYYSLDPGTTADDRQGARRGAPSEAPGRAQGRVRRRRSGEGARRGAAW